VPLPEQGNLDGGGVSDPEGVPGVQPADEGRAREPGGRERYRWNCESDPLLDPAVQKWAEGPLRSPA
jgi:hypothetical protein